MIIFVVFVALWDCCFLLHNEFVSASVNFAWNCIVIFIWCLRLLVTFSTYNLYLLVFSHFCSICWQSFGRFLELHAQLVALGNFTLMLNLHVVLVDILDCEFFV